MRTLHWSDRGPPEPHNLRARPVRHVRPSDLSLLRGRPRRHPLPPPALAATPRSGRPIAAVTFEDTPLANGASPAASGPG